MKIINIHSRYTLGLSNTYQVVCDIQNEDRTIVKNQWLIVTDKELKEYLDRKRKG